MSSLHQCMRTRLLGVSVESSKAILLQSRVLSPGTFDEYIFRLNLPPMSKGSLKAAEATPSTANSATPSTPEVMKRAGISANDESLVIGAAVFKQRSHTGMTIQRVPTSSCPQGGPIRQHEDELLFFQHLLGLPLLLLSSYDLWRIFGSLSEAAVQSTPQVVQFPSALQPMLPLLPWALLLVNLLFSTATQRAILHIIHKQGTVACGLTVRSVACPLPTLRSGLLAKIAWAHVRCTIDR